MNAEMAEVETENAAAPEPGGAARRFQFGSAAALSPARQESLENWHRNFLKAAAASLGDLLRADFGLALNAVKIQTYGEMVQERSAENQCVLFRMNPQPGIWLLDLPVALSLGVVDRMMGGSGQVPPSENAELTELDQAIFQQFAETLLADYAKSWKPHAELRAEVMKQVRNLNYQLFHHADDLILRVAIDVMFKEEKTTMWMIVPIKSVEHLLMKSLASDDRVKAEDQAVVKDRKSSVGSVPVTVSVRWQGFQLTLRDVENIEVGDVLMLDNKKCETAVVWLSNKPKFAAKVARDPQKTVVTVTGKME
jgi:flagellar motor switch protein FliM